MRRVWQVAALLWLLSIVVIVCADAQKPPRSLDARPTVFVPDDENRGLKNANPPSDAILNALLATSEAKEAHNELSGLNREDLRDLFEVVRVNLGPADEEDYVVHGTSLPMKGAENDWFWIVRNNRGHSEVVLFANGYSLELLKRMTSGYRDIRTVWSAPAYTLTDIYHFDGVRYEHTHRFTRTNRTP
jgi:hypothetical protein